MKKEIRTVVYDEDLRIEAYRFEGIVQPFPNHFHEHYVIGFVEEGERRLLCKNKEYKVKKGNLILFNPGDNHACVQSDGRTLDYRGINISKDVMLDLVEEITGRREFSGFSETIVWNEEITVCLCSLHEMVMSGSSDFGKEEMLLLLISALIQSYGQAFVCSVPEAMRPYYEEVEKACEFIREHFNERIYLNQICHYSGLSKSTLLRAFTKSKGITPYRYLETIRINEAKILLENGAQPLEVAMKTGFSDQSHFTNYFSSFIGVAPGVYREIFNKNN